MATFPIFGKGFVPEPDKKKRKTESEKNIKKKEYENNDRKREFQNNCTWLRFDDKQHFCQRNLIQI